MTATASGFYDNAGAAGPTTAACVAAAVGLSGHQAAPPQLILPAVLNPGEIYYIAENSMVVCVSQGHHLQHFHQPTPHQILYSAAPPGHHQRSSSLPSSRSSGAVSTAASSAAAVVTVASSGQRGGEGARKGRYHSGSFESAPTPGGQQHIFFSVPSLYSFAPPPHGAFPVAPAAEEEFASGQEEAVMEVEGQEAAAEPGNQAVQAGAPEVPTLPINILTNQELSMQHPAHVAHPSQAHHHSIYQPPTPTQAQQQMVYGLSAAAPPPQGAGPSQGQQQGPNAPNQVAPGGGGLPESTEQQLIRHHKLALSMLKNGSLVTAFHSMSGAGEAEVVESSAEEKRLGEYNIDSPWVPKSSLVERICGNQSDSLQIQCMSRCLSDFKPCMKEMEVDGRYYIRLRQHREMSLNVDTEYAVVADGEDQGEKRYQIVDDHMKEQVEKITKMFNATCEGREAVRLINRNSVVFYAEPGFTKEETDAITRSLRTTTDCECEKCRKLGFVIKFRCIIDDNRLAKLLEHTPSAPMTSYNMMPTGHGHPNGLQRPGLEMGMANLSLAGGPHDVGGMSSHMMQQGGPYSPLVSMGGVGQEAAVGLVSQAHMGHHAQAPQSAQQHPHAQQHPQQQSGYYQTTAGAHAGQAAAHIPHSATLAVSASSMFTGQPLLTLTTSPHSSAPSPGVLGWTAAAPGQQGGQQAPAGHSLQTPEFLFQHAYNVANITPGYPPNVASPSASSSSAHAQPPPHSAHHGPQHHHYSTSINPRHSSGANGGGRQLGGGGPGGLGGGAPGMGPKSLIGGSGPQKEKNLPPRLQTQHRMAQAAANAGGFPGPSYGPDFFINGPGPANPGGYYAGGGRGGAQGGGRRGGPPGSYGGSRGARGRPGNYHGGFGLHHAAVGPHATPITGPGGPMLHSQPASVPPTPPDLQADFPHLPRVTPAPGGGHQEAMGGGDSAVSPPAAPAPAPAVSAQPAAPGGAQQQPGSPVGAAAAAAAAAPLSTYAAVVVHGDANSAN